jgi:hypothetical protein
MKAADAKRACEICEGRGWLSVPISETRCCYRAEHECGGRGCTGPVEEMVEGQDMCWACRGTGEAPTADPPKGAELWETIRALAKEPT